MGKRTIKREQQMGVQPALPTSCLPMQPSMPLAGEPPMGPPAPAQPPSRDDAVKAAKAKMTRRRSLAKQRAQQAD